VTAAAMPHGTYADACALVGTVTPRRWSEGAVNESMIKYFCSSVEDGNPSYWDPEFAREQWGGVSVPPSMMVHWLLPPPWRPGDPPGGTLAPEVLATTVPLPGDTIINVSVDYTYVRPVLVGERLWMTEELTAVSPEKRTGLGTGHFVTTLATYGVGDDEVVATETNVLFRYRQEAS
jgi:uncharacterized protein